VSDRLTWIVCLVVPIMIYFFDTYENVWFNGYESGHELLGINGLICFVGLYLISKQDKKSLS
jgi:hypothetical protein